MKTSLIAALVVVALAMANQGCSRGGSTAASSSAPVSAPTQTEGKASSATSKGATTQTSPNSTLVSTKPMSTTEPAATMEPTPMPKPTVKPNPLTVKVSTDKGQAFKKLLPAKGGELEATSAQGVRYTLTIPDGALLFPEMISLAPVSKVDGLPLSGGLLGAVHLEPEGLELIKPATLTIQVPAGFEMKELMGFAYQGAGDEFQLYPVIAKGNTIIVNLMHFSGYGGGKGNESDAANMQNHQPSSALAQAQQQAAQIIDQGRRDGKDIESVLDELEPLWREFFYGTVYPQLKAAETNDKLIRAAAQQLLSWAREITLLGRRDHFNKEFVLGFQSLEKGIRNAYNKAFERCVKNPDIDEGSNMLVIAREATLINGFEGMNFDDLEFERIKPDLKNCFAFRLDYESIVEYDMAGEMKITAQVRSKVPLEPKDDFRSLTGHAPLEYVKFDVEVAGEAGEALRQYCPIATEKHDSTMIVHDFVLTQSLKDPSNKANAGFVLLDPGLPKDGYSLSCPGIFGDPGHKWYWLSGFETVNQERLVDGWDSNNIKAWLFDGFQRGNKPLIGRITGSNTKTVGGAVITETFTMELFHDPKK